MSNIVHIDHFIINPHNELSQTGYYLTQQRATKIYSLKFNPTSSLVTLPQLLHSQRHLAIETPWQSFSSFAFCNTRHSFNNYAKCTLPFLLSFHSEQEFSSLISFIALTINALFIHSFLQFLTFYDRKNRALSDAKPLSCWSLASYSSQGIPNPLAPILNRLLPYTGNSEVCM